ncbi:unnamed protein product [Didymodactylos carnosus]|uniref:Transposase n=1 Tax=Didymodactylos carnosus TaxID=1234261 RepID=A0A815HWV5_9BILA|nr:unnamed protein product [Didymodactylos carnosus]CAF4236734.1 unnamed protein product [Didymodactylos carnosus]
MIREVFPLSTALLCYFHVIKKLKEHIAKLAISIERKREILKLSKNIIYSDNVTVFAVNVYMLETASSMTEYWPYFHENWLSCTDLWVFYKRKQNLTYMNNTNNRIESFYRTVKRKFHERSKIPHIAEALTILMSLLRFKSIVQNYNIVRQELTSFCIANSKYPEFIEQCGRILSGEQYLSIMLLSNSVVPKFH